MGCGCRGVARWEDGLMDKEVEVWHGLMMNGSGNNGQMDGRRGV